MANVRSTMLSVLNSFTNRKADKNNPTGLVATDIGGMSKGDFSNEMLKYIPLESLDLEQVGNQSYFPLAISGAAEGAFAMNERRRYGICREADGTVAILRSATDSMKTGVYYATTKVDDNGNVLLARGTSTQYAPAGIPKPEAVWCHNNGVMVGFAEGNKVFVALTNGTFDAKHHVVATVAGDLAAFWSYGASAETFIYNNTVYVLIAHDNGNRYDIDVYTCPITSITNGGTATFTLMTGISGTSLEGIAVSNTNSIFLWHGLYTGTAPEGLLALNMHRAGLRMFSAIKGNTLRIMGGTAWYTNNTAYQPRNGMTTFYIDFDLFTKTYRFNPGAGTCTFVVDDTGGIRMRGPSTQCDMDADFRSGYWNIGSFNVVGNLSIRNDGMVTYCGNDNLVPPFVQSYQIKNYAGNLFDEIAKLNPEGLIDYTGWVMIEDRIVGALGPHQFASFVKKDKVFAIMQDARVDGGLEARIVQYNWNNVRHYKNAVVDVDGFAPSNNFSVVGTQYQMPAWMTVHMSNDQTVLSGAILVHGRLSTPTVPDPDTLVLSGATINITQADMDAAAALCWNAYTGTKFVPTKLIGALVVPPAETGAPCLYFVCGWNENTLDEGIVLCEVNVSARTGVTRVTGVAGVVFYMPRKAITGVWTSMATWGAIAYRKCSDGWQMAGPVPIGSSTAGNSSQHQFAAAKNSAGTWIMPIVTENFAYLSTVGAQYNVHPVWGIGYVDLNTSAVMGQGGQTFHAYGPTVADYASNTLKTHFMVSTVVAASGYDIYVNEPIEVIINGQYVESPVAHYNLKDIDPSPQNKTWYASVLRVNNSVRLDFSVSKVPDVKGTRINIGTITTGDTQITTMNLAKITKLGNDIL